jgi:hypothetical protein
LLVATLMNRLLTHTPEFFDTYRAEKSWRITGFYC